MTVNFVSHGDIEDSPVPSERHSSSAADGSSSLDSATPIPLSHQHFHRQNPL